MKVTQEQLRQSLPEDFLAGQIDKKAFFLAIKSPGGYLDGLGDADRASFTKFMIKTIEEENETRLMYNVRRSAFAQLAQEFRKWNASINRYDEGKTDKRPCNVDEFIISISDCYNVSLRTKEKSSLSDTTNDNFTVKIDDTTTFGSPNHNHNKHRVYLDGLSHKEALLLQKVISDLLR